MVSVPAPMGEVKGRDRARATRRKIIEAAHEEFVARGFHGATIAAIAGRAGVATQTVYFVFHTKPELISAVIDYAVMGGDDPEATTPEQSEWWQAMEKDRRAADALARFIRGAGPLFQRAAAISEVLWAAALTDPEVRKTYDFHDNLRREGFTQVIELLATKGTLKAGLDVAAATDIFMNVLSDHSYYDMVVGRGWDHDRYIEWLCHALPALLLER